MASTAPLFKELEELIEAQSYKKALHVTFQILAQDDKDPEALHCQLLCLMHQASFDEALALLDKRPELAHLAYERAYCLYRLKRFDDALRLLRPMTEHKAKQLTAQVLFGMGEYEQCSSVYEDLTATSTERQTELLVNYAASCTASCQPERAMRVFSQHKALAEGSYEFLFNAACSCITARDYSTAEDLLVRAEKLCLSSLKEDGYEDDDIDNEAAIIRVQLAYLYFMQQKRDRAVELLELVLKKRPTDSVVAAVAENNLIVLHPDQKLFNAEKKLAQANSPEMHAKLLPSQLNTLSFNHALMLLKMNKIEQCKALLDAIQARNPDTCLPTLINASLLFKDRKVDEGVALLHSFAASHKGDPQTTGVLLTLAQLLLKEGRVAETIAAFRQLPEADLYRPPFVATAIALLEQSKDLEAASALFDDAIAYWKVQAKSNPNVAKPVFVLLLRAAGEFFLRNKRGDKAVAYYTELSAQGDGVDGSNRNVPALVQALAYAQPELASKYLSSLRPLVVPSSIDAEQLENLPAPRETRVSEEIGAVAAAQPAAASAAAAAAALAAKKKSNKKKKKRLPKGYPDCPPPNPERWLPRTERKGYKKRRKANDSRASQGIAQGNAAEQAASLRAELASSSSSSSSSASSPSAATTPPAAAAAATPPRGAAPPAAAKRGRRGGKGRR